MRETIDDTLYDLIVVGGGPAGAGAALAGAREGLKVLLIEASGALGGAAVTALVNPFMVSRTHVGEGEETKLLNLSDGIFTEIRTELCRDGIFSAPEESDTFHEETLKIILDRKMKEAGVKVLFHAMLSNVVFKERKVESVSVTTVGGIYTFKAKTYVDATGDATLAAFAGLPFNLGRESDSLCQPMTLCFRVVNADVHDIWKNHKEVNELYAKFQAEGKIKNPRENILVFGTKIPNVIHFNTTRIIKHDPTDPFAVSEAEAMAREQVLELMNFLKENFSWFKNAALLSTASTIGARESRMIRARYMLNQEDLISLTKFDDAIAAGNYDIDIHSPDGSGTSHYWFKRSTYYTIPYRSLLPIDADNLIVAGRCIGCSHEAQASIRIMPICYCLGEAAGTAAAVAKEDDVNAADVDTSKVRSRLTQKGAFVG